MNGNILLEHQLPSLPISIAATPDCNILVPPLKYGISVGYSGNGLIELYVRDTTALTKISDYLLVPTDDVSTLSWAPNSTALVAGVSPMYVYLISDKSVTKLDATRNKGLTSVILQWTAIPNAVEYNIYRSVSGQPDNFVYHATTTSATYFDTGALSITTSNVWYLVRTVFIDPVAGKYEGGTSNLAHMVIVRLTNTNTQFGYGLSLPYRYTEFSSTQINKASDLFSRLNFNQFGYLDPIKAIRKWVPDWQGVGGGSWEIYPSNDFTLEPWQGISIVLNTAVGSPVMLQLVGSYERGLLLHLHRGEAFLVSLPPDFLITDNYRYPSVPAVAHKLKWITGHYCFYPFGQDPNAPNVQLGIGEVYPNPKILNYQILSYNTRIVQGIAYFVIVEETIGEKYQIPIMLPLY